MYTIILGIDGRFHCQFRLQDGTEYYTYDNLEEAIQSAKTFAKHMNGEKKLKRKHITFLQERQVVETKLTEWKP